VPFVRLVDPGLPIPLHRTFTEVTRSGRRDAVHELLADLIPGFERLEIIALAEDQFGLGITLDGLSVPLGLAGDGIQAFTQLALEIAVAPEGLVLVEEPEVYQHPKAIRQSARVLLANVRRGVQVVLTTHSLELIDALLAEGEDDLDDMALFNLAIEGGKLKSGLRKGAEIEFARQELESDLR
jgi:predicted ATPase